MVALGAGVLGGEVDASFVEPVCEGLHDVASAAGDSASQRRVGECGDGVGERVEIGVVAVVPGDPGVDGVDEAVEAVQVLLFS